MLCRYPALVVVVLLQMLAYSSHADPAPAVPELVEGTEEEPEEGAEQPPAVPEVVEETEEESEEGAEQRAEEMTITATRDERAAFEVPAAVTVFDRDQLDAKAARITPDLFRGVPGLFLQQTTPGQGIPIVRGLIGSSVLTLVDGMRLNNAIYRPAPNQYLALVDPYDVDRIEVVRGTGSALYGSDAMGGVLNVLTPTPRFEGDTWQARGRVLGQFGSADLSRIGHAALETGRQGVGLRVGGTFQRFDDLRGGDGLQEPTAYDAYSGNGKLFFARGGQELSLSGQYARQPRTPRYDELVPDFRHGATDPASQTFNFEPNDRIFSHAHYRSEAPIRWIEYAELDFAFQEINDDRRTSDFGSPIEKRERNRDRSYILDAEAASSIGDWSTWTYGFESTLDRVASSARDTDGATGESLPARGRFADGSKLDSYAIFLQGEVEPHPRWTVITGGRGSWYEIDIASADRGIGEERSLSDGTWNFGLVYHLLPEVNLVGNVGRGYRVPNIFDLSTLGNRPGNRFNIPSPGLGPESVLGADVGVKMRTSLASAELFAFRSEVEDKIRDLPTGELTPDGRQIVFAANLDRVLLYGVEAGARIFPIDELEIAASLTYTYGEEELPDGSEVPADLVPPLSGQVGLLAHVLPSVTIDAFVRFAGQQARLSDEDAQDPRINPDGTPEWLTLNAGIEWRLHQAVTARVRVENILDRTYREHGSGIDAPGVNAIAALDVRF